MASVHHLTPVLEGVPPRLPQSSRGVKLAPPSPHAFLPEATRQRTRNTFASTNGGTRLRVSLGRPTSLGRKTIEAVLPFSRKLSSRAYGQGLEDASRGENSAPALQAPPRHAPAQRLKFLARASTGATDHPGAPVPAVENSTVATNGAPVPQPAQLLGERALTEKASSESSGPGQEPSKKAAAQKAGAQLSEGDRLKPTTQPTTPSLASSGAAPRPSNSNGSSSFPPSPSAGQSLLAGSPLLTWRLVVGLLWKQRLRVALAAFALVVGTACNIGIPRASGKFLQTVITPATGTGTGASTLASIPRLLVPLGTLYVLEPVCTLAYVTCLCSAWEKVVAELRTVLFQRLLNQQISFFDKHKVSELTALLTSDLGYIQKGVVDNVSRDRGLRSLAEISASLVMIFALCPDLAPLLIVVVGGISLTAGLYKRAAGPVYLAALSAQSRIAAVAGETLAAIRTVRSFSGEGRQLSEFAEAVDASEKAGSESAFAKSASEAWTRGTVYVSLIGIYALLGGRVRSGQLPPGTLLTFVGYIFILTFAIQGFLNTTSDLQNVFAAVARINSLVPTKEADPCTTTDAWGTFHPGQQETQNGSVARQKPAATQNGLGAPVALPGGPCVSYAIEAAWHADISFEGVGFAYPERLDVQVLRGIDLRLKRGTVTALVGGSGAGKTTVVQLLSRFYEPVQGRICLGNWDIGFFDRSEWCKAVALVSQEPILFAMSIRDNIAYGRPDESDIADERIVAAAKAANAHDFIMSLPEGYSTLAGERGSLLSGGQKQRIAIARAILKDAPILILDEATSALDSVSERLVQDALEKLMKGRTTVVIAHRLSTVQQANEIAVLQQGRIVEKGSHTELLKKDGPYAELVNSQHMTFTS